jgi:hypothetical protein
MTGKLTRRSALSRIIGTAALAGGGWLSTARGALALTDRDHVDHAGRGYGTPPNGITDRDTTDRPERGNSGTTDTDPTDASGHGRRPTTRFNTCVTDRDANDAECRGRGRLNNTSDRDPTDPARGQGTQPN